MARFCSNCGHALGDGDRVCSNCGTPVAGLAAVPAEAAGAGKKKSFDIKAMLTDTSHKGIAKNASRIIAAIIVIVLLVNLLGSINFGGGYQSALNTFAKGIKNGNADTILSVLSVANGEDRNDKIAENYEELAEEYAEELGKIKKVTIEPISKDAADDISDRKVNAFKEELEDKYDIDASSIKSIKKVRVSIKFEGEDDDYSTTATWYLIKEKGGWKIYFGNNGTP